MKTILSIILLFLSTQTMANNWLAADENLIKLASCRPLALTSEDIKESLKKLDAGERITTRIEIFGEKFRFVNETRAWIKVVKDFFSVHSTDELENSKFIKLYKDNLKLFAKCRTGRCYLKTFFGQEEMEMMAYIKYFYGYNTSPFLRTKGLAMQTKDLKAILTSLNDFSKFTLPRVKNGNKKMVKLDIDKGRVYANASVHLFHGWFSLPFYEQVLTLSHELAHTLTKKIALDGTKQWLELSGWKHPKGEPDALLFSYVTKRSNFVSQYAARNPMEDFAESFMAYRYDGDKFKREHPLKYDYMRVVVFNGKEYLGKRCMLMPRIFSEHLEYMKENKSDIAYFLKNNAAKEENVKDVLNWCAKEVNDYALSLGQRSPDQCLTNKLKGLVVVEMLKKSNFVDKKYSELYYQHQKKSLLKLGEVLDLSVNQESVDKFITKAKEKVLTTLTTGLQTTGLHAGNKNILSHCNKVSKYFLRYSFEYRKTLKRDDFDIELFNDSYKDIAKEICVKFNKAPYKDINEFKEKVQNYFLDTFPPIK